MFGVSTAVVSGGVLRDDTEQWVLPPDAVARMRPVLTRAGFDIEGPIHVRMTIEPPRFVFSQ